MNGKELLEAMSFIDEELLAEAEAPARGSGWKRWSALAACVCILSLSGFYLRWQHGGITADTASPESALAMGAAEHDAVLTEECAAEGTPREAETNEIADEAGSIESAGEAEAAAPTARIRAIELTEGGFIALVLTDVQGLEGMTVTVIPEAGLDLSGVEAGAEYTVWILPTEEDGTLRICDIRQEEQED